MSTIRVEIVSAEKEIYSGDAVMVFAPASQGEVGIAPQHAPLVTQMSPGEVRVELENGEELGFFVSGGLLEILPKVVTVLSDSADRTEDLDEAAVIKAKEEAEKVFAEATEVDYAHAQLQLVEASARYEAMQRLKRKGS